MHVIFSNLTDKTLAAIEDHLSNDEVSMDEELIDLFIEQLDLTLEQAEAALGFRDQYRNMIFLEGHGPLHQQDTLVFNPETKSFN